MRIGISARGLSEVSGGVKQYITSVTQSLLEIDSDNQYFVFHNSDEFSGKFHNAKEIFLKTKNKLIWDYVELPRALKKNKIDICIFPKNVVPFNVKCKSIVIIHDLLHIKDPKVYKWFDSLYMRLLIPFSVKKADKIVTDSKSTSNDLIELTGATKENVSVIYLAADDKYHPLNDSNEENSNVLKKYNLKLPYLLYIGSLSPRKNIPFLIKAFEEFMKANNIDIQLVLAGGKSWKDEEIHQTISKSPYRENIILTGFVDDDDLPYIYNQAEVFIYPSLYEGFGIPILEAMASGCPVLTSNTSSPPEVAGDAVLYFDPTNINDLVQNISKVVNNNELQTDLIEKGLKRVKEFSWKKTAQSIVLIYDEIYKSSR